MSNDASMKFCRTCGNSVRPQAIACPKCGVPPKKNKKHCYHCGAATRSEAIICVQCNAPLNMAATNEKPFSLWGGFIRSFSRYATFKGRARRREFFSFMLFTGLFWFVLQLVCVFFIPASLIPALLIPRYTVTRRGEEHITHGGTCIIVDHSAAIHCGDVATLSRYRRKWACSLARLHMLCSGLLFWFLGAAT